ncbi:MAG: HDOD domain-containing protein [Thermodesulfobacteriota bacterium]
MSDKAHSFLKKFNNLKTLPHVAIRLTQLIADERTTVRELEEIIRLDPTLVLRLLRMVNSPYYGLRQKVGSIAEAVTFLGIDNLRNIVVVEAMKDIFKSGRQDHRFSFSKLWLHSAVVAICCQMVAERVFRQKGENAFLCGILHDIGLIAAAQVEPDLFFQIWEHDIPDSGTMIARERETLGTDHCDLGYHLTGEWKIAAPVREGIRQHHNSERKLSASDIGGILQISEYLSSRLEYTMIPGLRPGLPQILLQHLRENIMEYRVITGDLPEEIAKAREMYQSPEEPQP